VRSPSGKLWVPYEGPENAKVVVVGESPAARECEQGRPFVGRAGRVLDTCLSSADLERGDLRILNEVPVRAPGDKFARHTPADLEWGKRLLAAELRRAIRHGAKVIMPLGNNPLEAVAPGLPAPPKWSDDEATKRKSVSKIAVWRGSLFPLGNSMNSISLYEHAAYDQYEGPAYVLPSYHPAAVARQYSWHPLLVNDLRRAREFSEGTWQWPTQREWFVNKYHMLDQLVDYIIDIEGVFAIDTEMSPYWIVALVTEAQCHVFEWNERARAPLTRLMQSKVAKVAHNLGHDMTFVKCVLGIDPRPPFVDTGGLLAIYNQALPRNLSPGMASTFTTWPYHKWMVEHDAKRYCGYDTIVCYDAYWSLLKQVVEGGQLPLANHDMDLLGRLLRMQWRGVDIDDTRRIEALEDYHREHGEAVAHFQNLATPLVRENFARLDKPHLFRSRRQCPCCGGGSVSRTHCWRCAGMAHKPTKKAHYEGLFDRLSAVTGDVPGDFKHTTVPQLREMMPECVTCGGEGKVEQWEEINPDSPDQLKDILYKAAGIRPRKYKGNVTTRADQLAPLAGTPIVDATIAVSKASANIVTMERMAPDIDGKTHSVFNPWGTASGRVSSSEGLIQKGTNIQNVPKKSRHVFVAPPGRLLVAPDMAQIEGRCMAVVSGDPNLWKAYTEPVDWPGHPKHGEIDSHVKVVQMMKEIAGKEISRDQAKRLTYASFYGGGAPQVAVELSAEAVRKGEGKRVSRTEAQSYLDAIFTVFSKVKDLHLEQVQALLQNRFLETPTGRRRHWTSYITKKVREPKPGDHVLQQWEKKGVMWYQVLDHKIAKEGWALFPQDMAAYVLAVALRQLETHVGDLVWAHIHVHDELVLSIPATEPEKSEALEAITKHMTVRLWDMDFPMDFDPPAPNWRCAKGVHVYEEGRCVDCGAVGDGA
jgi:DNA polymerase I-like protein with 3'-5' exonuclease and polymerase domains/uracil-DNA glycosylase